MSSKNKKIVLPYHFSLFFCFLRLNDNSISFSEYINLLGSKAVLVHSTLVILDRLGKHSKNFIKLMGISLIDKGF